MGEDKKPPLSILTSHLSITEQLEIIECITEIISLKAIDIKYIKCT